jgi:hypothetical protein
MFYYLVVLASYTHCLAALANPRPKPANKCAQCSVGGQIKK